MPSHDDEERGLARERTGLAWERSALAFGALGAIVLGVAAHQDLPILLGGVLAWTSYDRWEANERAMRLQEPLPGTGPPRLLAAVLALLALVIAVLVIANVVHA